LLTAVDTEVSLPSPSGGMRRFVAWFRTKARIDDATAVGTVPYRRIGAIVVQVGTKLPQFDLCHHQSCLSSFELAPLSCSRSQRRVSRTLPVAIAMLVSAAP
jgi:hypothetical protein